MISIRETNNQLSRGILPSSLDYGYIPNADKLEECLRRQQQASNYDQADLLIEEIKSVQPYESSPSSIYYTDDYDEFEYVESYTYEKKAKTGNKFKKSISKMKSSIMGFF
ncbi:hypothetical protein K502DRAFT_344903 [Neoconidiobolus thromboides FSU 785]|nr:hypothetical protein K502DRAFT_344903 [Neoconidiobolus thromboides FSU 785]